MPRPHFIIKNNFQRRRDFFYEDLLTAEILTDVCRRITGRTQYTVDFDDEGYNIGRLATLEYQGRISYISFFESEIRSRNSSFQSFPSALVRYHQEENANKGIYFYFLPTNGNIETPYFIFMYRLMKTAGTVFLNEEDNLENEVVPFNSVEDITAQRNLNRGRNRGNRSTYVTADEDNTWQIYGKTYGANKYETTLLALAIHGITAQLELYEIPEGNLRLLPDSAREVLIALGITVITSNLAIEREQYLREDSLRSPTYIYNLLEKLGDKKCALCNCEIPQIIQGAHVWPVASIKNTANINQAEKLEFALDGDNGLWLCNNHHKLFDIHYLYLNTEGRIKYKSNITENEGDFICNVTINPQIRAEILTPVFLQHLARRNRRLNEAHYSFVE